MREILMDGKDWVRPDDVYEAFFEAVGAPAWHGRNFNALRDSISGGRINRIDPPYLIKVDNYSLIGEGAREAASNFISLIKELRESGCDVDVEAQN